VTALHGELAGFSKFGGRTLVQDLPHRGGRLPVYINEFWTSGQREAHRLHEISYRACFKPQLPRFFIERLSGPGDAVFDPFMGRGTTLLEAALLGRVPAGTDSNPLARMLIAPRLNPPVPGQVAARLEEIDTRFSLEPAEDLHVFYHPETLREICSLREYLIERERTGEADPTDAWIRMVALNRLTGHSPGFFSVYTLPPNQAASITAQKRINARLQQSPPYRDVKKLILKKSRRLLAGVTPEERRSLASLNARGHVLTSPAASVPAISSNSATLVVTSPPFLDTVNYKADNWLRCWFAGIPIVPLDITMCAKIPDWQAAMTGALRETFRILAPRGHVAFEVGEVRKGSVALEENVVAAGADAGLTPLWVLVNAQAFTKTANCWGVDNNSRGTNTNRIVVFQKD